MATTSRLVTDAVSWSPHGDVAVERRPRRSAGAVVEILGRESPGLDDYLDPSGEGFGAWLRLWQGLGRGEADPLGHPAITRAWLRHLALPSGRDFRLFVVRDPRDGRLMAVHPSEVVPARLGPGCLLRHEPEFYLEDASLSARAEDRAAVVAAIGRQRVPGAGRVRGLTLGRVDDTGAASAPRRAIVVEEGHRSIIDLRRGWRGVEGRLSKNFRCNLAKAARKLDGLEGVELDTLVEADGAVRGLRRFVDVAGRSWKGEAGSSLADDDGLRRFWDGVLRVCAPRGEAVIQVLRAGGDDIAAQICLHLGDTLHVMKVAYDAEHGRLAPGNLLLWRAMQGYCAEHGVQWVSLVTGLDWHDKWRPERLRTVRRLVPPPGPLGEASSLSALEPREAARFALARLGCLQAARRLRRRLGRVTSGRVS